jgi:hypothetical protein
MKSPVKEEMIFVDVSNQYKINETRVLSLGIIVQEIGSFQVAEWLTIPSTT